MTKRLGIVRTLVLIGIVHILINYSTYAQNIVIETKEQSIARMENEIQKTAHDTSLVFLHKELFYVYVNDNLDLALHHIQKSIQYALDAQLLDYVTLSYSDFGNTYGLKGDFNKALESFETARSYNQNLSSKDRSPFIDFNMGRFWIDLNEYDLAKIMLLRAASNFDVDRNKWLPNYELTRIALYTADTAAVLAELPLLENAIPETDNQVNTDYLYHYLVLAELYAEVNHLKKASDILSRIDPYVVAHNRNYYRGILNYSYALINFKKQQYTSAITYAEKANTFFGLQKEFYYNMKSLKVLADSHSALNNYTQAYSHLLEYNERNDAIREAQRSAVIAHLKSTSQSPLFSDSPMYAVQANGERRTVIIYLLVAFIIALGIVTVILFRSAQDKNKIAEQLTNLNLDKNHFIGVVSHDLRSPLNSIMVLAEFMREDPEMMDQETAKEYGGIIFNSSQQMQHLLNNMLDVNKIESNQTKITITKLDVLPILKSSFESISILGKSKSIRTSLKVPENLPHINGNENAITRILENLISNAYKFSPAESMVTIEAKEVGTQVEISISDQGPGLTELDKTKLFKKFEKLSATPTGNEKSTGLGLYIVKNLVQQMDGTILIESEQGKGTTFIVLLNKA